MSLANLLAGCHELFYRTQGNGPLRRSLDSRIDMSEGETLDNEFFFHGTVIYRPQVAHVKRDGIHGNPA